MVRLGDMLEYGSVVGRLGVSRSGIDIMERDLAFRMVDG